MRKLPFEPATFDAIVSAYVFERLNSEGIQQSVVEAGRVVKPGGDFLLILIAKEPWLKYTFGPMLMHAGLRGADWWTPRLQEGRELINSSTHNLTKAVCGLFAASMLLVPRPREFVLTDCTSEGRECGIEALSKLGIPARPR